MDRPDVTKDFNITNDSLAELKVINDLEQLKKAEDRAFKNKASHQELAYLLHLLEESQERAKFSGTKKWFVPGTPFSLEKLPRHAGFFRAGAKNRERLFMAANRSGKTVGGAYEMGLHVTGEYPDHWQGRRFDHPIKAWACGKTGQTTRDTVQKELMGDLGAWGTGMIPKDRIIDTSSRAGVPGALDTVQVRHVSGGVSILGFKSYDQDEQAFYGTAIHVGWCDEEPPLRIYNEIVIRTMTTGGIVYVTCTPLQGLTPFIVEFCKSAEFGEGAIAPVLAGSDE